MQRVKFSLVAALALFSAVLPIARADSLADSFPVGTVVYISWPGGPTFAASATETDWGKILAEPQVAQFHARLAPALLGLVKHLAAEDGPPPEMIDAVYSLAGKLWRYPVALGLIDISANGLMPELALVIKAGDDSAALQTELETLLAQVGLPLDAAIDAPVPEGSPKFKELTIIGPTAPIRWGVVGDRLILTVGRKINELLAPNSELKPLSASNRFQAAMKPGNGSDDTPIFYLDLKRTVNLLEQFQPMFAESEVPVLGEKGGLQKVLGEIGFGDAQSFSVVLAPHESVLRTTAFLHNPVKADAVGATGEPITDADLACIPRDPSWAFATNFDLAGFFAGLGKALQLIDADAYQEMQKGLADFEQNVGVSLGNDLLGAFGNTIIGYDDPNVGGLWFTGMTFLVDLKPDHKFPQTAETLVAALNKLAEGRVAITLRQEDYREHTLYYLNIAGGPIPVVPAFTLHENRVILALFPQMIRPALDQILDKQPNLLDNPEFQRGRKLLPDKLCSVSYNDSPDAVRQMYSILMPIMQMGLQFGQGYGLDLTPELLPNLSTVLKHVHPAVSGAVADEQGYISYTQGSLPIELPALNSAGGIYTAAMTTSIMLPSLARARAMARRSVSASNLRQIAMGCLMYANDHGDSLPPDLQTLIDADILQPQMLIAPNDHSGGPSYTYIAGQRNIMDPNNVIAHERPDLNNYEGVNVAFLDGHVEFMNMMQFEEALNATMERLNSGGQPGQEPGTDAPAEEPTTEQPAEPEAAAEPSPEDLEKIAQVKKTLAGDGPVAKAITQYQKHVGAYPEELIDLIQKPADTDRAAKWKGPYIKSITHLIDPWDNELLYTTDGDGYRIGSSGPDGRAGTADDVTSE